MDSTVSATLSGAEGAASHNANSKIECTAVEKRLAWYGCAIQIALIAFIAVLVAGESRAADKPAQPQYKVVELPDIRVRMGDGVELAVRITRPDVPGRFPAVMAFNPYRTLTTLRTVWREREYSNDVNGPSYLAQHGYVSVNYDVRGTGASGGSTAHMYSDAERQDGYDMVEWIAAQPWSNGNVGMWGFSYGGVVSWQIAAMAPPHLKAVIVGSGTEDVYTDWTYPGGMPRSFFVYGEFAAFMAAFNFAPPDPQSSGEKWAELWQEHLANNVPWTIGFLQHQTDDAYWRTRSVRPDYGRIRCAVFVIGGWADWYPSAELRAFSNLKVPKRALIGPWGHSWPENAFPGPRIDARPEYLKWFDQFLKGVDTGVLKEPPVTIYVNRYQPPARLYTEQNGFWRNELEWPLSRTRYTPMYLSAQGRLNQLSQMKEETERDTYVYRVSVGATTGILAEAPWAPSEDQRPDEAYSLSYTTSPLATALEVTGDPAVNLFVTSSADVAYFAVRVCDVAPDGVSKLVSVGGLNATHRHSDTRPEPLRPGQIYELKFRLKSMAYVFAAGHRIRVDISSSDFLNAWPVSKAAVNAVVRGARFPSRVILPVAPPQHNPLPQPHLLPSPDPMPDSAEHPEYSVAYDQTDKTETVSVFDKEWRAMYTVSNADPAEAMANSRFDYVVPTPIGLIKIDAQTTTVSDATAFRHFVEVFVTVNGHKRFSKDWTVSVPRVLN